MIEYEDMSDEVFMDYAREQKEFWTSAYADCKKAIKPATDTLSVIKTRRPHTVSEFLDIVATGKAREESGE